ncbi:MAG: hypothetical protein Q9187_007082 [Circinaria calcarea]
MSSPETPIEPHQGSALRRGKHLPPIQTDLASKLNPGRLQRPRPIDTIIYEKPVGRVSVVPESPLLKRRDSRAGLLALFSRSKSFKKDKQVNVAWEEDESTEKNPVVSSKTLSSTASPRPSLVPVPLTESTPKPILKSTHSGTITPKIKSLRNDRELTTLKAWDPPPLFQAYPQAVKHATLPALILGADAILRMDRDKQGTSTRQGMAQNEWHVASTSDVATEEQKDGGKRKHKHRISGSIAKQEWTTKVFVLATSGFLVQYAGEGDHDRLPEKILQLGKNSVAFASDAIKGEYYVLQISQMANEDGTIIRTPSKSVFSKFRLRGDFRRSVSNFLLVFDKADEMNAWLIAVRREVEGLGGKPYRPTTNVRKTTDEVVQQLRERPSRRYLIQRDPNQFSRTQISAGTLPVMTFEDTGSEVSSWIQPATDGLSSSDFSRRQSFAHRMSVDAPSTTHTSVSLDQVQLDKLRESSMYSYTSTDAKTFATSCGPSPVHSPSKSRFTVDEVYLDDSNSRPPTIAERSRRKSFQTLPSPAIALQQSFNKSNNSSLPRPQSINDSGLRSFSPAPPNFSAPISSKRYSNANMLPNGPVRLPSSGTSDREPSPGHQRVITNTTDRPESIVGELPSSIHMGPKLPRHFVNSNSECTPFSATLAAWNKQSQDGESHAEPSSAEDLTPRRYSSLDYSRGALPYNFTRANPSPHPPPQIALPDIPVSKTISPNSPYENRHPRSSTSCPANAQKLRRPASLQVNSDPLPLPNPRSFPNTKPPISKANSTSLSSSTLTNQVSSTSTSLQLPAQGSQNRRLDRKSMPQIAFRGPPPLGPLPSIPPLMMGRNNAEVTSSRWPEYSIGGRRSFQGVQVS